MPPNIHDIEHFVLLRQALDILEAPEGVQRGLYPDDRDPGLEMATLYGDVWEPVDRLFAPILEREFHRTLQQIAAGLEDESVDWSVLRVLAKRAGDLLQAPRRSGPPRAWLDQMVRGPNHLMVRGQGHGAAGPND